jgi:hypothetical protein
MDARRGCLGLSQQQPPYHVKISDVRSAILVDEDHCSSAVSVLPFVAVCRYVVVADLDNVCFFVHRIFQKCLY